MRRVVCLGVVMSMLWLVPADALPQGWMGGSVLSSVQPEMKAEVGYAFGPRGMAFTADYQWPFPIFEIKYPVEGLWLGLCLEKPPRANLGLFLKGTWLAPISQRISDFGFLDFQLFRSRWDTKTQWYTLDVAATYPVDSTFDVLAGFRFDSLDTTFKNSDADGGRGFVPSDYAWLMDREDHLSFACYIPYVGLSLQYGQAVRLSVIGTPFFWDSLVYIRNTGPNDTLAGRWASSWEFRSRPASTAYFIEATAEYGWDVGVGKANLLAKWTYLRTTFPGILNANTSTGRDSEELEGLTLSACRQNVVLAGSFTVPFTSPW